jgi:NAD-dependent SIR2 family protein deacetylase
MNLEFSREKIEKYMENNLTKSHPILKAHKSGKLIVFVGAGMSVHLGIPSWREFALRFLDIIYNNNGTTFMNYKTKESFKNEDTIKLLSIWKKIGDNILLKRLLKENYEKWFDLNKINKNNNLYEKLYELNAIFITTNYDNALDIIAENYNSIQSTIEIDLPSNTPKYTKNVYYEIEELEKSILIPKNVIHIHGSFKNDKKMVISYEDYIRIYGGNNDDSLKELRARYSEFLTEIFAKDNVVLFIGYGLEEIQILQYLFEKDLQNSTQL